MAANTIGSTYSSLIQEHYEKKLLNTQKIQNDLLKYPMQFTIPKGQSDVIHLNRIELYGLAQSVTDGTDLSSPRSPTVTEIKGKLELKGDYISFSPYGDEIRIASILDNAYDQFNLQMGRTANNQVQTVLSNGDTSTGNSFSPFKKLYAGNASSFAELDNSGNYKIKQNDIRRAASFVRKNGAIGPIYTILNPWSYEDLLSDPEFQTLISRMDLTVLKTDELPQWAGTKIGWQFDPWRENLASAGGAEGTYAAGGAVNTTWVFGQNAFGAIQLMGRGGMRPKYKYQDITKVGVEATLGYFYPFKGGACGQTTGTPGSGGICTWGVALRSVATNVDGVSSIS